jgi:UDP-GlcNAc3NAcA epimerase
MNVLTIVGARPQFIKAAAVSRELRKQHREVLVHTGQHYDYGMSGVFFDGLEIPKPEVNLGVGSGSHGAQTGAMLRGIEEVLLAERPDWVLVYGDTNSTLAGALAASKLMIPVAHVEAGLRSFNRRMPEEVNRVVADHLSNLLLCPSRTAVDSLMAEGIDRNVHLVGDVMLDVLNWAREHSKRRAAEVMGGLGIKSREYLLVTVHRSENTDDPGKLSAIVDALNSLSETVLFPVHPRTRKAIEAANYRLAPHIRLMEPFGYFEMLAAAAAARLILTDSGGLQKEAYWLGVPCITLRAETEWVETVEAGWNLLTGANCDRVIQAVRSFAPPVERPALYGDGKVAAKCVALMEQGSTDSLPEAASGKTPAVVT